MRLLKLMSMMAVVVLVAAPAWAACSIHPNPGIYQTYTGTLLPGHVTEAWCTPAYQQPGVPGNTENAMSWGPPLGAQWHVWGMAIDAAGPQKTGEYWTAPGDGWIDYVTNYVGGQFWLSRFHTWSDGINDLTGVITYYNVSSRVRFVGGIMVGLTSNVMFTGRFDECPQCTLRYVIANAIEVWNVAPGDYPPFLCGASAGEYFDACCIRADIFCPVSTDESTWGAIKSLYR